MVGKEEKNLIFAAADQAGAGAPCYSFGDYEEQLRVLMSLLPNAVCFKDGQGRWLMANETMLRNFGLAGVDYVGKTDRELSEYSRDFAELFLQCAKMDEMVWEAAEPMQLEEEHRFADGRVIVLAVTKAPFYYPDGRRRGLAIIGCDITEKRQMEACDALCREIDRQVLEGQSLDDILQFTCDHLASLFDYPLVWIGLKKSDGKVAIRTRSGSCSGYIDDLEVRWDDTPEGQGAVGLAIRSGRTQRIQIHDPHFAPWKERANKYGIQSALVLPLMVQGEIIGTLNLYSSRVNTFHDAINMQLEAFASRFAIALGAEMQSQQVHLQTSALSAAANPIVITDKDGVIQWINPAFSEHTGYTLEEVQGLTPRIMKSGKHPREFYEKMWETILSGKVWKGEIFNKRKDGSHYFEEMTITPVRGVDGEISHFVAFKQDISERIRLQEELRAMSMMDELTGLYNRRGFFSMAGQQLEIANRNGREMLLIFADLDDLKGINDTLGHQQGDQALEGLASVLRNTFRKSDIIGRLGGDEFVVLVTEAVGDESEVRVRERFQENVRKFNAAKKRPFTLSVSLGMVRYDPKHPETLDELVTMADSLMYVKKRQGR